MRRREFVTLLGSAAATWPLAARARQPMPVVGFLSPAAAETNTHLVCAIARDWEQTGFVEGRNIVIEFRWAGDQNARLSPLAAELVQIPAQVIIVSGYPAARSAKAATSTIPIVFNTGEDPVRFALSMG